MMFNFFLKLSSTVRSKDSFFPHFKPFFYGFTLLLSMVLGGCLTGPPLPKVNLSEPGWNIRQGQAVWRTKKDAPDIAGEVLAATRADGSAFVQFTKTPFPFAIAQMSPRGWQIEFPPQNKHFAAPGSPPARIVWFQLANALLERPVAKGWTWSNSDTNWRLKNSSSGESLEGYFTQ
ncbi:MAG TPA: hypothetical protein VH597_17690 [Verrucomicrobiae bacterium]|jgi:hypothetical protein|nr:hypothetical protein [Verrucomicrobiae bacterium]